MYKKFKFGHTNKWYMHNLEPTRENETYKVFWDFEIKSDYLILAWRAENQQKRKRKKRTCWKVVFVVPAHH